MLLERCILGDFCIYIHRRLFILFWCIILLLPSVCHITTILCANRQLFTNSRRSATHEDSKIIRSTLVITRCVYHDGRIWGMHLLFGYSANEFSRIKKNPFSNGVFISENETIQFFNTCCSRTWPKKLKSGIFHLCSCVIGAIILSWLLSSAIWNFLLAHLSGYYSCNKPEIVDLSFCGEVLMKILNALVSEQFSFRGRREGGGYFRFTFSS